MYPIGGGNMITHEKILNDENSAPEWMIFFEPREIEYLKHVVNGLIEHGNFSVTVEYKCQNNERIFHIYEPFNTLNYLGFLSPSVVSIVFKEGNKIEFWVGDDNGLSILSNRLSLESQSSLPKNSHHQIDFWHFIDNIGTMVKFEKP